MYITYYNARNDPARHTTLLTDERCNRNPSGDRLGWLSHRSYGFAGTNLLVNHLADADPSSCEQLRGQDGLWILNSSKSYIQRPVTLW